jgi:hypothetical protein
MTESLIDVPVLHAKAQQEIHQKEQPTNIATKSSDHTNTLSTQSADVHSRALLSQKYYNALSAFGDVMNSARHEAVARSNTAEHVRVVDEDSFNDDPREHSDD